MVIGKLAVNLGLNSSTFNTGLQNVSTRVRSFASEIEAPQTKLQKLTTTLGAVRSAFVKLAVVVGAGMIARSIRSEIGALDALAEKAQTLGVVAGRLRELQFAGSMKGIDPAALNMSMQK